MEGRGRKGVFYKFFMKCYNFEIFCLIIVLVFFKYMFNKWVELVRESLLGLELTLSV